jgi:hypothetical protein
VGSANYNALMDMEVTDPGSGTAPLRSSLGGVRPLLDAGASRVMGG